MSDEQSEKTKVKTPFDFGVFEDCVTAQDKGRWVEMLDLHGRGTDVWWLIHGIESQRYRDAMRYVEDRRIEDAKLRPEAEEDRNLDHARLYAGCVSQWRTGDREFLLWRGQELTCMRENVEKILLASMLVRGQVMNVVNNAAGFING